jgi:hypothetical protein
MLENIKAIVTLITIIVVIGIYAVNLYRKYKAQGKEAAIADLRETVYALFLRAEEKYGRHTGPDKMAYAIKLFYEHVMPDNFEKLLPGTTVEKFLQDTFDTGYGKLKDFLDDGELNKSVS